VPAATDQRGRPLDGPLYVLAQRIAAALADGDVDLLTELCARSDPATRGAVRTAQGRRGLLRLLRAHPAADPSAGGSGLVYPGLAVLPCADGIASEAACTAEQFRDVGLLGLRPQPGLNGHVYAAPATDSMHLRMNDDGAAWMGRYRPAS
jgi:hypothetical protein